MFFFSLWSMGPSYKINKCNEFVTAFVCINCSFLFLLYFSTLYFNRRPIDSIQKTLLLWMIVKFMKSAYLLSGTTKGLKLSPLAKKRDLKCKIKLYNCNYYSYNRALGFWGISQQITNKNTHYFVFTLLCLMNVWTQIVKFTKTYSIASFLGP